MDPVNPTQSPTVSSAAIPILPPGAMPLRMLLDQAMRSTRTAGRRLYPTLAAVTVLWSASMVLFQVHLMRSIFAEDWLTTCVSYLVMLAVVPVIGLVFAAAQVAALDSLAGRPASIGRGLRFLLRPRRLLTLVGTGVLAFASYMACLLPVLYVGPLLSLVLPVMVEEERTGMAAIERSVRLVGANPFTDFPRNPLVRIAVFLVVAFAISMLGSLVAQMPFEIARQVLFLRHAAAEDPLAAMTSPGALALQGAGGVLGGLVSAAVGLYSAFGMALLFHDTRSRREGADLEAAAALIEAQRAAVAGRGEAPA
jgi:hypothetical protein